MKCSKNFNIGHIFLTTKPTDPIYFTSIDSFCVYLVGSPYSNTPNYMTFYPDIWPSFEKKIESNFYNGYNPWTSDPLDLALHIYVHTLCSVKT